MTAAAPTHPSPTPLEAGAAPAGWQQLRGDPDVQFAPVTIPETPPPQPGWLSKQIDKLFTWLGDALAPLGEALANSWWWLQWVLAGIVALFVIVLLVRLYDPAFLRRRKGSGGGDDAGAEGWHPDAAASQALLEDADRLAAEGRFDEATHLLLRRSVAQIAAARPDWVEPSSTARELAGLPALPGPARAAFGVIAGRVEASLFALRALERADWEAARAAYAEFALARIDGVQADRRALAA